jgi:stage II sporulation protein D
MLGTIVTGVTRRPTTIRPSRRGATAGLLAAGILAAALVTTAPAGVAAPGGAPATTPPMYPVPPGGVYTIHGRGEGHGHGMSQWGAYGAAKVGHLSANQILHFYYPHTTLATRSTARAIRVLLSSADAPERGYVQVAPAAGLAVTPAGGKASVLASTTSSHHAITGWRLARHGTGLLLRARSAGVWHTTRTLAAAASLTDTAAVIPVVTPGGLIRYRGAVTAELEAGALEAVDVVNIEMYLRSVVPAEMPSSWSAAALAAQAVAARTYARHGLNNPKASWYDVDGDTRDQAYGGVGIETARTTRAVESTAGETIVDSHDHAVLAQYAAADGGWTVSGGESYLPAKADPYDGAVPNSAHAWTRRVAASELVADYPQLGALKGIEITGRNGDGAWGGRVTTLTLVGSKESVPLSGTDLQLALGLGSTWFRPTPLPAAPTGLHATVDGAKLTATWRAPVSVAGAAVVSGYRLRVSPGGRHVTVGPTMRTAAVKGLAAGTYAVSVIALSAAGTGPPATASVTVTATK